MFQLEGIPVSSEKKLRVNEEIRTPKVRLIGPSGNQVGIVSVREALAIARDADLDLVEISPNTDPPVCRVMDFGKFQFQQNKQKAAARRKQHVMQIKEVKFRPTIEEGDYQVKLRNLIRFLNEGDKVRITLRFRGREISHQEQGAKIMQRLQADLVPHGLMEQESRLEGRQLIMVMVPKKGTGTSSASTTTATTVTATPVSNNNGKLNAE